MRKVDRLVASAAFTVTLGVIYLTQEMLRRAGQSTTDTWPLVVTLAASIISFGAVFEMAHILLMRTVDARQNRPLSGSWYFVLLTLDEGARITAIRKGTAALRTDNEMFSCDGVAYKDEAASSRWAGYGRVVQGPNPTVAFAFKSESLTGARGDTLGLMRLTWTDKGKDGRYHRARGSFVDVLPPRHRGSISFFRNSCEYGEALKACRIQAPLSEGSALFVMQLVHDETLSTPEE